MFLRRLSILVERGGGCYGYGNVGRWKCNATSSCIPFTEQCDGECWQNIPKCADECRPPGIKNGFYECKWDNGQEQCLTESEKCNGKCKPGFDECGQKCLPPGELNNKYKDCYGYCIPISRECIGKLSPLPLTNQY